MKLVTIESPYAGDVDANEAYLKKCLLDSVSRGEAPFASHGFYTQFLDDTVPAERKTGMACGFEWMKATDLIAVYVDRGVSKGMIAGIENAQKLGIPIEFRRLADKKDSKPEKWIPDELPKEYFKIFKMVDFSDKEKPSDRTVFNMLYLGDYPSGHFEKGGKIPTPPRPEMK